MSLQLVLNPPHMLQAYSVYGDPLRDLWVEILRQGDAETLLTLLPTFPALEQNEQADPKAFWKFAFELYFPEYLEKFNDVIWMDWKKMTLWLTFAHRSLLKHIAASNFAGTKSSSAETFFGLIYTPESTVSIDTSRIIWKGNAKFVRDWVKYDLMVDSGRLFACFFYTKEQNDATFDMTESKLLRKALFSNYINMFDLFDSREMRRAKSMQNGSENHPNEKYIEGKWWDFFFYAKGIPMTMRWIFHLLFEAVGEDRDPRQYWDLFDRIPDTPAEAMGTKDSFLGKCVSALE